MTLANFIKIRPTSTLVGLLLLLLFFRVAFGLTTEFWAEDELQIYLIGLKSFTTNTWPYYGPDVVYTNTQIPGALQGLLISLPLYVIPAPESPAIFLNILNFLSLCFLGYYACKRISTMPKWVVYIWILSLTWTMDFGTRVVNPSYVLIFSIPFFIALFEVLPIYSNAILQKKWAYFILGLTLLFIMQLHLSYVLLFPFLLWAIANEIRKKNALHVKIMYGLFLLAGILIGGSTLIPTWLLNDQVKSTSSNIVLNLENFKNIFIILLRYLSFASYEIPYTLGPHTSGRLAVIKEHWWMAPFTLYLLLFGSLSVIYYLFAFVKIKSKGAWQHIKWLTLAGYILVFLSFFFSIKGPSSHTFFILFPLPLFYSLYGMEWLWNRSKIWKGLIIAAFCSCLFFYSGLGLYNLKHKSLYKNRDKAVSAIEKKDYRILGLRRY